MISIRLKIILIIIFCTLTLGGVIAFFSISKGADLLEEQAITLILSNTRNLANKIESENNKIESIMSTVATVMANNFQFEIAKVNKEYIEERINYLTEIDSKLLEQSNRSGGGVMSIYATFNVDIFNEQAIIAYSLLPNKQVVATYVNRSDIFNDIYALRINLIFFSIIMIVLSAILGFVLIAPIISRINKLKDAATT